MQASKFKVNVAVGIPSTDAWVVQFGLSLATMCSFFGMTRIPGCSEQRLHILSSQGSMLPQLREQLVLSAMKAGCSHLLMVDSDMKFPRDVMHKLLSHNKDIVAANCVTKRIPAEVTARGFQDEAVYSDEKAFGLEEVESVGTAVILIRLAVMQRIPRPWFCQEWMPEIQHFCGEDRYFIRKARKYGFKTFIDHDLSKKVSYHLHVFLILFFFLEIF